MKEDRSQKFKIKATGQVLPAIGKHGFPHIVGRYVSFGNELNATVIDLFDDTTGEVRSYLDTHLERMTD